MQQAVSYYRSGTRRASDCNGRCASDWFGLGTQNAHPIPSIIIRKGAPEMFSYFARRNRGRRDSMRGTFGGDVRILYEDSYCEGAELRQPFSYFDFFLLRKE